MNFIKSLELLGVEATQIPCIELHGVPTPSTEGAIGLLGMNVDSPDYTIYKCVFSEGGVYVWREICPAAQFDWNQTDPNQKDYINNKPAIAKGAGENAIVENNLGATATGKAARASGRNTEAQNAFSTAQGNQTHAVSMNAAASGFGSIAGGRGFEIKSCRAGNNGNGYYTLSAIDGISVGDEYSVRLNSVKYKTGKVVAISGNEVEVSNYDSTLYVDSSAYNAPEAENYDPNKVPTRENYFMVYGKPTVGDREVGFNAVAFGENTQATDRDAFAAGRDTKAIGQYSTAVGRNTVAGYAAFASGKDTQALGEEAHSEGYKTYALANCAHAEGQETYAKAIASHSEGSSYDQDGENLMYNGAVRKLEAKGHASHAEGGSSQTGDNAYYAHAEGWLTTAEGVASHTEGRGTTASGGASHAEGYGTKAEGYASHAEGHNSNAHSDSAHAEGSGANATGCFCRNSNRSKSLPETPTHIDSKSPSSLFFLISIISYDELSADSECRPVRAPAHGPTGCFDRRRTNCPDRS